MNRPMHEDEAIDAERVQRARAVWRGAEPSPFEVAVAEERIASRTRARAARSSRYLVVPAVAAAALFVAYLARHRAPPIAPVSEIAPPPAILAPAAPPDAAARDTSRLAAAEALHRAGQCRAAKPALEDLAARGATPDIRARAQTLLDEIAHLPPR